MNSILLLILESYFSYHIRHHLWVYLPAPRDAPLSERFHARSAHILFKMHKRLKSEVVQLKPVHYQIRSSSLLLKKQVMLLANVIGFLQAHLFSCADVFGNPQVCDIHLYPIDASKQPVVLTCNPIDVANWYTAVMILRIRMRLPWHIVRYICSLNPYITQLVMRTT